jgi:hypothetical protein
MANVASTTDVFPRVGTHPENKMKTLYWILWPAFLVAVLATGFLIAAVDPQAIQLAGYPITLSNLGAYSLGFLVVWALAAASSLTTCILRRSGDEINRSLCN